MSGILIAIIIGGIYFELQTPGVGFPILASLVALVLYFTPYYLNGLAENWELIAFGIGIILISLEVFVIPGFGVAGIMGIILTVGALILAMLNNDNFDFSFVGSSDIFLATITALTGLVGAIIVMAIGGVRLANSKVFQRISLEDVQDAGQGFSSSTYKTKSLVGKTGKVIYDFETQRTH